jgi:hypothetical protein
MISLSKEWKSGVWTSNIDCDQFYSDDMTKKILKEVNKHDSQFGLLSGSENSFFDNFNNFTNEYEKRTYNNMPHKIYKNTNFMPTRATVIESFDLKFKNFFKSDFYINKVENLNVGEYNHYKFKFNKTRFKDGYNLGDRRAPDLREYSFNQYLDKHPKIVNVFFTISEK